MRTIGIVGHADEKFDAKHAEDARVAIRQIILENLFQSGRVAKIRVCSGRSPMGGVDIWAESEAEKFDVPTLIFPPKVGSWSRKGGYRERNLEIARNSDVVYVVVVTKLPEGYKGMRFNGCYHCKGRNPDHVKSGGCWTAWKAVQLKKKAKWILIP